MGTKIAKYMNTRRLSYILVSTIILILSGPRPGLVQEENIGTTSSKAPREEKISLDLKGVDVAELLKILSLKTGLNIVPSRSVSGRVNVFLKEVTFTDALDVILISNDLAADKRGGIIYVMTADEYLRTYGQRYNEKRRVFSFKLNYTNPKNVFSALENLKSEIGRVIVDEASATVILIDTPEKIELMRQKAEELDRSQVSEVFDIKYAKAADLKTQLATALTEGVGQMRVDERTNRMVISDLPEKMKKIKQMVKAFDSEHQEVFIEGEIVQISLNKKFERGINWEEIVRKVHNLDFKGSFAVSPALSAYKQISIGTLATDDYTAVFQLLQTYGDTKILSRPRIAAISNEEAKIMVGTREAYVTSTVSQGSSSTTVTSENVQFIDVGVKLSVIPQVNKDGFITMKIKPEISSTKEPLKTPSGSVIPIVETSEAETMVKVKDGAMVMIAGLMKEEKRSDKQGIPILSQIPFMGAAFGNRSTQNKKSELIIFITPHIMSGEVSYIGSSGQNNPNIPKTPTVLEKVDQNLKGLKEDTNEVKPR